MNPTAVPANRRTDIPAAGALQLVTDLGQVFKLIGGSCGAFFIFGMPGALCLQVRCCCRRRCRCRRGMFPLALVVLLHLPRALLVALPTAAYLLLFVLSF